MTEPEANPFTEYHRVGRRMTLARVIPIAAVCLAVGVALGYGAAAAPAPVTPVADVVIAPTPTPTPVALPEPAATPRAEEPPPPAALPTTGAWTIDIDTTGYQAEIDECLWVRMELGAVAPVVGAHNYCGGDVVLGMQLGDTVTLTGTGLDGVYTVASARDAHAGDFADAATAGMVADVILQTCYWEGVGNERLVALTLKP